jgi:hypothetical protein
MLDDAIEVATGGWGWGLALAAGVGLLAWRGGRPLAKGAVRGYLVASDTMRSWTANAVEQAQDLYAESKAEIDNSANNGAVEAKTASAGA